MKKLLALLLVAFMCCSLCSCSLFSDESYYEKQIHNEMKKYAGKWVESYQGDVQEDDLYIELFEDGVYMIFNISAGDFMYDFDTLDLERHGNLGTWDVRNGYIYFYSTSDGGRRDVFGYEIIDNDKIEVSAEYGAYLVRIEKY